MNAPVEIVVCMGSSCFARGNRENLQLIERFIAERELNARVTLSGSRCEDLCSTGPNVRIAGKMYQGMDEGMLLDLLKRYFPAEE